MKTFIINATTPFEALSNIQSTLQAEGLEFALPSTQLAILNHINHHFLHPVDLSGFGEWSTLLVKNETKCFDIRHREFAIHTDMDGSTFPASVMFWESKESRRQHEDEVADLHQADASFPAAVLQSVGRANGQDLYLYIGTAAKVSDKIRVHVNGHIVSDRLKEVIGW